MTHIVRALLFKYLCSHFFLSAVLVSEVKELKVLTNMSDDENEPHTAARYFHNVVKCGDALLRIFPETPWEMIKVEENDLEYSELLAMCKTA